VLGWAESAWSGTRERLLGLRTEAGLADANGHLGSEHGRCDL